MFPVYFLSKKNENFFFVNPVQFPTRGEGGWAAVSPRAADFEPTFPTQFLLVHWQWTSLTGKSNQNMWVWWVPQYKLLKLHAQSPCNILWVWKVIQFLEKIGLAYITEKTFIIDSDSYLLQTTMWILKKQWTVNTSKALRPWQHLMLKQWWSKGEVIGAMPPLALANHQKLS